MPKKHRLSHAEITARTGGRRVHGTLFSLSVSPLVAGQPKTTCVVSKKVAIKAHDRNRIKRHCREAVRPLMKGVGATVALVIHARKEASGASFRSIQEDVKSLLMRAF